MTKKKSFDQAALIAQILAVLQPQISSIVDSSIDEVEEVTEKKRQKHCHCPLWKPSEKLVASMCGGQPSRRYKEQLKRRKEVKEDGCSFQ